MNKKQVEQLAKLLVNKNFLAQVNEVRTKYSIPAKGIVDDENLAKWNKMILNAFLKRGGFDFSREIYQLLRIVKLSDRYYLSVANYIFFNEFTVSVSPVVIEQSFNAKTNEVECRLQIFGDTNSRDVKNIWPEIMKIQKGENAFHRELPGYQKHYKQLKNLVRDSEIRRLHEEEGLSLKKTCNKINELFPDTFISYEQIPHIIERHKRLIGEKN